MKTVSAHAASDEACDTQHYRPFFPFTTLKCFGRSLYRSQQARDYACLLDVDPAVLSWSSFTRPIIADGAEQEPCKHYIDFIVETADEKLMVEVGHRGSGVAWLPEVVERQGYRYKAVIMSEIERGPRLQNARDLLRYAGFHPRLGDRIRILGALAEYGTLTLAECLSLVREGRAMETVSALILTGIIFVDLDEALLGPDSVLRRITD